MICYLDRTFCPFWMNCQDGDECHRALTKEVEDGAKEWWGRDHPPICIYGEKPKCFKEDE